MSFKFPTINFQSLQESLPTVDLVKESFSKVNAGKTVDQFKESLQPFTARTTQLISSQLQQVQSLANSHANTNIEVSELPADYLQLEKGCDLLLNLYTDLIHFTNDTYAKVSYDYPPGNYALNKLRDANVGGIIGNKFNQLKNVSSPQELEKILLGNKTEEATIQTTSVDIPKTLYGQLSQVAEKHSEELRDSNSALSLDLLQISSTYLEIANARLDMDKTIMNDLNIKLVELLDQQFVKVNESRKKVYSTRSEFDLLRSKIPEDEENEELIAKEDELVNATEAAVLEMKQLLKPSKSVSFLKIFVDAQKEWFLLASKKLDSLSESLDNLDVKEDDE